MDSHSLLEFFSLGDGDQTPKIAQQVKVLLCQALHGDWLKVLRVEDIVLHTCLKLHGCDIYLQMCLLAGHFGSSMACTIKLSTKEEIAQQHATSRRCAAPMFSANRDAPSQSTFVWLFSR